MKFQRFRALAPLSLLLILSACWTSDKPLMPAKEMDAVKLGKAYWSVETDPALKPDRYVLTPKGKAIEAKVAIPGKTSTTPDTLTFDRLQGSLYLAQIVNTDGKMRGYRIFDLGTKGEVRTYDPTCGVDEKSNPKISVTDNDCKFFDYATLRQRALVRAAGIAKGDVLHGKLVKTYKEESAK